MRSLAQTNETYILEDCFQPLQIGKMSTGFDPVQWNGVRFHPPRQRGAALLVALPREQLFESDLVALFSLSGEPLY